MVTTRRGTGTGPSVESTPRSSVRKTRAKRELDTEETPTASKRRRKSVEIQKKSPAESEDIQESTEESSKNSEVDVSETVEVNADNASEDPSRAISVDKDLPIRRRSSPEVVIQKTSEAETEDEPDFHTPAQIASSVASRAPVEDPTPVPVKTAAKRGRKGKKSVDESPAPASSFPDEIPSSTWETENVVSPAQEDGSEPTPKPKKMRFGSEEPAEPSAILPEPSATAPEVEAEDDDGSDSDEAPEVVTAATAVSKAKAAEEDASRAHKAQQEKARRKRQERQDRIAEEQAEKRKREEKKAKKLARQEEKQAAAFKFEPVRTALDVDMDNLPALLPESILEAAGDQRPPTPPRVRAGKSAEELKKEKLNRHIKFLEHGEKPIKDVKKGNLNVSVLAKQSMLLAPKVNRNTKNVREHWLKGRQVEKRTKSGKRRMEFKKVERRAGGGGFLRGGDD
ncbi:hypothetical protein BS50DRAFT_567441 [Corynespora cassiicola Philippines]|uniref:U3 snoRNA associated-domain-containing protein n=1 Tax=Corynespora cassiicola Philippines TaxID=1448308 RepID=A0A2T2PAF8_CORCC|nr:hypothetical protein BS50DRAFT_567441 [Corynespora cassiicola Philippines]